MAAIDLSAEANRPTIYTQASIATTWQAYTLPAWASKVSVIGEGAAIYVGVDTGAETPADGGAVGTHRVPVAADTLTEFNVRAQPYTADRATQGEAVAPSVFLAAQSGTATITLVVE